MDKILSYTEERHEWGEPSSPANETPPPGVMFVFYKDGVPVMVDFLCPCGCGSTCPTHLVPPGEDKKPNDRRWNFSAGPTLSPSIRYVGGCKAHFNITNGKTVFHSDSGR